MGLHWETLKELYKFPMANSEGEQLLLLQKVTWGVYLVATYRRNAGHIF